VLVLVEVELERIDDGRQLFHGVRPDDDRRHLRHAEKPGEGKRRHRRATLPRLSLERVELVERVV
jgi:hypothetical protein